MNVHNPTVLHSTTRHVMNPTVLHSTTRRVMNPTVLHSTTRRVMNPTVLHSTTRRVINKLFYIKLVNTPKHFVLSRHMISCFLSSVIWCHSIGAAVKMQKLQEFNSIFWVKISKYYYISNAIQRAYSDSNSSNCL